MAILRSRRAVAALLAVAVAVTGTLVATDAAFAEPNPVTDLTSTPVADGTMGRLSWTPVPGATSYTVRLSVTDAAVASAYVQLTTSTNSIIPGAYLATLPGEQIVYWKVAATVEASTGNVTTAYSEVAGFTRAALPAPVTTPVTSPVVYPAATSFAWAPVTGASSYTVQWSQDSTFATGVTKTTTTATSWTPTTALTRDAPWYWQVAANLVSYAFTNTSTPALTSVATAPSDGGSFSIVWDEPSTGTDESRPVLLSDGSNSSGWVSDPILSWAPVTGAKYYLVSVGTAVSGSAVTSLVIDSAVSYATTYVPRQLLEDKAYFWQVTAVDSAGGKGHASSYKEFHKAWGAQTAPTSVSLAGTTAPVPNGGAYSGASTLGAAPSVPIDRLELSWQPLARATEYVVSVYGVVLDPSDPSQGSASSVPFATCTTASTSATIISGAQEVSAAADGMTACLWPSDASKRLTVGQTYKWGVEAYMVDATKTTVRVHSASSYDTAPLYFSLGAAASGPVVNADSYVISGDETAFATQTVTALKGQPAPVFTWSPVSGATLYQVEISLNKDFTSTAARFWTPQTTLRPTGVLADTTTSLPYYWRVKGGTFKTATSLDFDKSAWPPAADAGYSWRTWQRLSTKTLAAPTPVTQVDGAVVLRWAPESESAPNDGGTGGYVVRIYEGDSATGTPVNTDAGTKTNVPFLVACTGTCATDVPLTEGGRYTFTVNPLNALGAEGTVSDAVSFTVAASAPVLGATVTDAGGASRRLSWSPTPGAQSYVVSVTPPSGVTSLGGNALPISVSTAQTSVTIPGTGASDGTYAWSVKAIKPGTSIVGAVSSGSFTVAASPPEQSTAAGVVLSALTTDGDEGRLLSWSPVVGATRYLLTITPSTGTVITDTTITTSYVVAAKLVFGVTYTWTVQALTGDATPTAKQIARGTSSARAFAALAVPTRFSSASRVVAGTSITWSWLKPTTAAALGTADDVWYVLQWRVKPATTSADWTGADQYETSPLTPELAHLESDLPVATTFESRIAIRSAQGQSGWYQFTDVTTPDVPQAPPTNVAIVPAATTAKLTWTAVPSMANGGSAVTGYRVRYRVSGTEEWTQVSATSTSITLTGLAMATSYQLEVAATNLVGEGPILSATMTTLSVPTAPRSVKAVAKSTSAVVTWAAPASTGGSSITGYAVSQRIYSTTRKTWGSWTNVGKVGATARSFTRSGLVNGTKYQFQVAAVTALGTGAVAATLSVTPAAIPSAPSASVKTTTGKFTVSWHAAAANGATVSKYTVQYSTNGNTWTTLKSLSASARSYTSSVGRKGATLYARVFATNAMGAGLPSSSLRFVKR